VLEELGALSHLNTSFKHFVIFCWEFDLLKSCEEDALRELIDEIRRRHLAAK
jgi:Mob1/phocein family